MSTQAAAEPAGGSVRASTEYVVLKYAETPVDADKASPGWQNVDNIAARSPAEAVRAYATKTEATETLTLAAVPARYWYTETLKARTVTTWEAA